MKEMHKFFGKFFLTSGIALLAIVVNIALLSIKVDIKRAAAAPGDDCKVNGLMGVRDDMGKCITSGGQSAAQNASNNATGGGAITIQNGNCQDLIVGRTGNDAVVGENSIFRWFCSNTANPDRNVIYVVIEQIADYMTKFLFFILGLVIAYCGVQISASSGNPSIVAAAKKRMTYAISSYALIAVGRLILDLIGVTGGGTFLGVDITNIDLRGYSSSNTLVQLISAISNYVAFAAGAVSVAFVIVGGIRMMTSTGSPQALASARKTIIYALVGLAISVAVPLIVSLVPKILLG